MKSISEENERNVYGEYFKAYLQEHSEEAEEHIPKMGDIDFYSNRGISIQYNYDIEKERLSTAYFKVYDHDAFFPRRELQNYISRIAAWNTTEIHMENSVGFLAQRI